MKTFEPGFFALENFIRQQETFDFLDLHTGEPWHVAYNVNDPFFQIMGASMVSVLENNPGHSFVFHLFTDGYSRDNAEKVRTLTKKWHCRCTLYELDMEPFQDFHVKVARFSRITYGRLYMAKVLKEETDRFLYLDADTMVIRPLEALFALSMEGKAMGAVSERPKDAAYRGGYLKLKNGRYFNDGIMIINISEWEKQGITEKAFSFQKEPRERFLGQSQDVLNLTFDGTNLFLPPVYNEFGGGEDDQGNGVIIHWTGRRKPWQMVLAPFDAQWRQYNALSPWETITNTLPIKKPENYHDFKQWAKYRKKDSLIDYLWGMGWYAILKMRYKIG